MAAYKTVAVNIIAQAYSALPEMQSGFTDYGEKIYDATVKGEQRHRRSRPSSIPCGISVKVAAEYFVVKFLREAVEENLDTINPALVVELRHEVLIAYALNKKFRVQLLEWYVSVDWAGFNQLDYAELVN